MSAQKALDGLKERLTYSADPTDVSKLTAAVEGVLTLADTWDALAKGTSQADSTLRACVFALRAAVEFSLKDAKPWPAAS